MAAILDWTPFTVAFVLFLASHAVPARPALRARLVRALGDRVYLLLYAGLSVVLLGWLIVAAARAPFVPLWTFEPWQLRVPAIVMPVAILLAACALGAPNPLSFGGARNERFDPAAPGVAGVVRHPLLWAIGLWAASHLVPNGDLAHVLLFGVFIAMAVAGMVALDRRHRRRCGEARWRVLAQATSNMPLGSLLDGRWHPGRPTAGLLLRVVLGLSVWIVLLALHPIVIGVSPLPH